MRDPDSYLISRLRFRHLALVECLGSERSIRKAARSMHISEPAVSKALAEIETSFGFTLFERSAAGVVPTERGAAIIEGARLLLNALRNVRRTAAQAERRLTIRLGMAPFLGQTVLPAVVRELQRASGDVAMQVREGPGPEMLQQLVDGQIDAMLMSMSHEVVQAQRATTLTYRPLMPVGLSVIAARDHVLARRRRITWAELAAYPWLLPPEPSVVEAAVRNAFLAHGVVPPQPRIRTASPSTNLALVAAGLGVGAVPSPIAQTGHARDAVVELPVYPKGRLPPVSLVYHAAAAGSRAIVALEQAVAAACPA
jgi:DNA-binding transcriptional LysR family regulator